VVFAYIDSAFICSILYTWSCGWMSKRHSLSACLSVSRTAKMIWNDDSWWNSPSSMVHIVIQQLRLPVQHWVQHQFLLLFRFQSRVSLWIGSRFWSVYSSSSEDSWSIHIKDIYIMTINARIYAYFSCPCWIRVCTHILFCDCMHRTTMLLSTSVSYGLHGVTFNIFCYVFYFTF